MLKIDFNKMCPMPGGGMNHALAGRWKSLILVSVPGLILCLGLAAQSSTFLNHDVAWVLYSSRWVFDGAVFGRDIVAANPPLIWWISLLPNGIAMLAGLPVIAVFRFGLAGIAAASLFATGRLLYSPGDRSLSRLLFLAVCAWLLMFAVHRDFGQREHLTVILILPYLAALVRRSEAQQLPIGWGWLIGASAGIAIALKPHFVVVPLVLEGWLLWRSKTLKQLFRPEAMGAIAVVALYAAAIFIFAKPWLEHTILDIGRVYWAFDQYGADAETLLARKLLCPLLFFALVFVGSRSTASMVFFMAAAGFLVAAVWQGKFYTYHVYPSYALLVLGAFARTEWAGSARHLLIAASAAIVLFLSLSESKQSLLARQPRGSVGTSIAAVSEFVERSVPQGGSFIAISTHPFPGFPTALYVHPRWGSRSNSQIYLPAVVRLRSGERSGDPELLSFAEFKAHKAMDEDMKRKPDLVLVDISPWRHAIGGAKFDFVEFYREDPAFSSLWSDYVQLPKSPRGYAAYALRRTPQVATGAKP